MRRALAGLVAIAVGSCVPPPPSPRVIVREPPAAPAPAPAPAPPPVNRVLAEESHFAFTGGRIAITLEQRGDRVVDTARNHYMVPIAMAWSTTGLANLEPLGATEGVAILPPARKPDGEGPPVELARYAVRDPQREPHRTVLVRARFGDPDARPNSYAYALPYGAKLAFAVLQGFHGAFSHHGSNEFAVDFDCPVATTVRAARPGVVVATNDAAIGSGVTADYFDLRRVNFVYVLHDDGTLGEYMHLSPSGVLVAPGQVVTRGEPLALSGNTGYSSTPHLHFQVVTAAEDGVAAHPFPFAFAVSAHRSELPVQGRTYVAWE